MILVDAGKVRRGRGKPRASGDDPPDVCDIDESRMVNPARAGMIRNSTAEFMLHHSKPRASGDDPTVAGGRK